MFSMLITRYKRILGAKTEVKEGTSHPTIQFVEKNGNTTHTFNYGTTGYGKNSDIPLEDRKPIVVELDKKL